MFDNDLAKKIQADTLQALEAIGKKYKVTITNNGGMLSENDFVMKLKVEMTGVVKKYADCIYDSYGLPKDIIGQSFENGGLTHTISEFALRAPKFPIITTASDGKHYKFTVDMIKHLLKLK